MENIKVSQIYKFINSYVMLTSFGDFLKYNILGHFWDQNVFLQDFYEIDYVT